MIGDLNAIVPLYGNLGRDMCLIEAGAMSQLLRTHGHDYGIGVCQIGHFQFAPVEHGFKLGTNQILLTSLIGGSVVADAAAVQGDAAAVSLDQLKEDLAGYLEATLPQHMRPSRIVVLDAFPVTANGKVDRAGLPDPGTVVDQNLQACVAPENELETVIAEVWKELLDLEHISVERNLFDLGANSALIVKAYHRLCERIHRTFPLITMFRYPTTRSLARQLATDSGNTEEQAASKARAEKRKQRLTAAKDATPETQPQRRKLIDMGNELANGIAIIGMAGRFPGAGSTDQFWRNLEQGIESVTFFSDEELKAAQVGEELLNRDNYVKASTLLENVDRFDAAFFGIPQREAMVLDPQHRFFLECSWEAFEHAGYVPDRYPGLIGVYAGASLNTYMMVNLACNPMYLSTPEGFQVLIGNEKDYLATRVAYKFNLRGPAVTVQTACSTSLAAVHMACQSLHLGECDMALAGGVSIKIPQVMGYFRQEGMPFSSDGHCRAFDAGSSGTVFGSGVGVVLLKRLEDAVEDNDNILAVIRASSMNNDGSSKVGFTAPSSRGQSDVISQTLAIADIPPETITYVEAHGTGTPLGDPIEIEALTDAYSAGTDKKGYCAIGSVKTNVGHLETASGVAGLIKVVQMLRHGRLVPSLNFEAANPQIRFEDTPFFVNRETREWPKSDKHPRRAAVSSFGMGGTNVHAILEEAPQVREQTIEAPPFALLTLSSRSRKGLDEATEALRVWLNEHPQADIGRVAATLQLGRKAFEYRRTVVCKDLADAVRVLDTKAPDRVLTCQAQRRPYRGVHVCRGRRPIRRDDGWPVSRREVFLLYRR